MCWLSVVACSTKRPQGCYGDVSLVGSSAICCYGDVFVVCSPLPPPPTQGVSSFKVYMSYKKRMIRDDDVIRVFGETRRLGAVAMVHAENGDAICEVRAEAGGCSGTGVDRREK